MLVKVVERERGGWYDKVVIPAAAVTDTDTDTLLDTLAHEHEFVERAKFDRCKLMRNKFLQTLLLLLLAPTLERNGMAPAAPGLTLDGWFNEWTWLHVLFHVKHFRNNWIAGCSLQ